MVLYIKGYNLGEEIGENFGEQLTREDISINTEEGITFNRLRLSKKVMPAKRKVS